MHLPLGFFDQHHLKAIQHSIEGSDILLKVILLCGRIAQVEKRILFNEAVVKSFEPITFFVTVCK